MWNWYLQNWLLQHVTSLLWLSFTLLCTHTHTQSWLAVFKKWMQPTRNGWIWYLFHPQAVKLSIYFLVLTRIRTCHRISKMYQISDLIPTVTSAARHHCFLSHTAQCSKGLYHGDSVNSESAHLSYCVCDFYTLILDQQPAVCLSKWFRSSSPYNRK